MPENEKKTGSLPVIDAFRRTLNALRSPFDPGADSGSGKNLEFITGPGGRIIAGYWVEDPLTGERTFQEIDTYFPKDVSGGGGSSYNDLLQAASSALTGFLQAQSLADARNINAAETAMKAAQFALPEGATDFPGYGPGGIAHALAAQLGLKQFAPPKPVPTRINPAKLSQPGDIGDAARSFIDRVLAAGGARGGARSQ
jgi:hypothetical protein